MRMEDATITFRVRFIPSLWDAIKMRIAGVGALQHFAEKINEQQSGDASAAGTGEQVEVDK